MGEDSLTLASLRRGGDYLRVADPQWPNPLDPTYAQARGGRWNPPRTFSVLYLNADVATARANVDRRFAGLPYGPTDIQPQRQPVLIGATVPSDEYVDIVTAQGCARAGLLVSYPLDGEGREVPHEQCQPIGAAAKARDFPGVACRSAARPQGEELAWFTEDGGAPTSRRTFDDWYWVAPADPSPGA